MGRGRGEDGKQVTHAPFVNESVRERHRAADRVPVAATVARTVDVAGLDKLVDDAVGGPFGDTDAVADLTKTYPGILGDAEQNSGVVGEERPRWRFGRRHSF